MMDSFEEQLPAAGGRELLIVDIDGFEGPLDLLLTLARQQKVDLTQISILALAEQYLVFISEARQLRLEIAADYLVMAAWLAYLKSRLLLPDDEEDEPSGEELAARLAFQLQRLEAMRAAAARLMARPRLGREVFGRGMPEGVRVIRKSVYQVSLYDLLKAYADHRTRFAPPSFRVEPPPVYSVEESIERLRALLGSVPDWQTLEAFLPTDIDSDLGRRSAVASTFAATLELVRQGQIQLQQGNPFGIIYVRRTNDGK